MLGLRPREARLEVIRRALTETAGDVKASEHWTAEEVAAGHGLPLGDGRLAQVAVAGYRLLDPRRRRTLFERVQLLLWTEEEFDSASVSCVWDATLPASQAAVGDGFPPLPASLPALYGAVPTAKPIAPPVTPPIAAIAQRTEETQAALEVFRSLRRRDRRATALWVGVAALAISLPAAVALVLALV